MAGTMPSASRNSKQTARLLKDVESLNNNPLPFILNLEHEVDEGTNQIKGILIGPNNSPYENGHFRFLIKFPSTYPFQRPDFFFLTRICHPNVHTESGEACHDELIATWSPKISIVTILTKMHSLLAEPDYNKYYEEETVPGKDPESAKQWTQEYAIPK